MIMSRSNISVPNGLIVDGIGRANGVVEVSGEQVLQQSDLIDRVLAMAFDVLGYKTLEIRVRPRRERANLTAQEEITCQATN